MKKLRVLVLMHEDLVPPDTLAGLSEDEAETLRTEFDVVQAIRSLGHEVQMLGVRDELVPIRAAIEGWRPHIAYNLLDEFQGQAVYDQNVVSYLELLRMRYTGCNPRGLILTRDKALSKKILTYHRVRSPRFYVFPRGRRVRKPVGLHYPLIVKSLLEEASMGIAKASLVESDAKLEERVRFVHERVQTDAIAEQFIRGREIYVPVLGNDRLRVLPPQELVVGDQAPGDVLIATEKVKHDRAYQKRHGVEVRIPDDLADGLGARLARLSKRIYRNLAMDGYGRIDYRVDADGEIWFLEANPNPEIAHDEEFALAARASGLEYASLIQRILALGLKR